MPGRRGRPPHDDVLTPAEWRVTEAVRHGMSNPQIAARMGTSLDAVKFHVANILAKLELRSRAELWRWNGITFTAARIDELLVANCNRRVDVRSTMRREYSGERHRNQH